MLVNPKYAEPPLTVPLDAPTEVSAEAENAQVTIKWTDPKDKYATPEGEEAQDPQQLVAVWDHTVLVRKVGSNPTGPSDGTVVVSTTVRNQYQTTGYTDTGLSNDTSYHYGVFSFNEDGVASAGAFVEATPIAGTPLAQLAEGTLIKILENGSPVEFYLAKHSYEPDLNGAGRELLVRKDGYKTSVKWSTLDGSGSNVYPNNSMDRWYNNNYKNLLSSSLQSMIGTTSFYAAEGGGNYSSMVLERAIFMLSYTELGGSGYSSPSLGSRLSIYQTLLPFYVNGNGRNQPTRTPNKQDYGNYIDNGISYLWFTDGEWIYASVSCNQSYPPRPCFTLPSSALVDVNLNLIEE